MEGAGDERGRSRGDVSPPPPQYSVLRGLRLPVSVDEEQSDSDSISSGATATVTATATTTSSADTPHQHPPSPPHRRKTHHALERGRKVGTMAPPAPRRHHTHTDLGRVYQTPRALKPQTSLPEFTERSSPVIAPGVDSVGGPDGDDATGTQEGDQDDDVFYSTLTDDNAGQGSSEPAPPPLPRRTVTASHASPAAMSPSSRPRHKLMSTSTASPRSSGVPGRRPTGGGGTLEPELVPMWPRDTYYEDMDDLYERIDEDSSPNNNSNNATTAASFHEVLDHDLVLMRPANSTETTQRMSMLIADNTSRSSHGSAPPVPTRPPSILHTSAADAEGLTLIPIPKPLIKLNSMRPIHPSRSEFSTKYLSSTHLETGGTVDYKTPQTLTWKKKYCVVDDSSITIYNSVKRERVLLKQSLENQTHVRRLGLHDKRHQFAVHGLGFSIVFGTETPQEVEAWVSAIEATIKRLKRPTSTFKGKIQGWCIKCKHGFRRKRWIALVGCVIFYSKAPSLLPLGRIELNIADMHTFDPEENSDPEDEEGVRPEYSLQITTNRAVYHLIFPSKTERDKWAFYCGNVVGVPFAGIGTPLERTFRSVASSQSSNSSHALWKIDERLSSTYPLAAALTTLPSPQLEQRALQLWKQIQLFTSTHQEGPAIVYHLKLAQQLMADVVKEPELHDELLCQLVKATNTTEAPTYRQHQAWQLLCLAVPFQPPAKIVYRFLRAYLEDVAADSADEFSSKFAKHVHRSLLRTIVTGGRTAPPSLLEVESAVCRHPGDFAFPMSVTVFLSNDNHYLAGFDAATTFNELVSEVCAALGIRPPEESGFALYMNDPTAPDDPISLCTRPRQNVCDALHEWERLFSMARSGLVSMACPTISFRRRFWLDDDEVSTNAAVVENVLVCYEIAGRIAANAFPLPPADSARIIGQLAQIEFGALGTDAERRAVLPIIKERFYPTEDFSGFLDTTAGSKSDVDVDDIVLSTWRNSEGLDSGSLSISILKIASQWKFMASTVLPADLHPSHLTPHTQPVWLAINRRGVHVLSSRFEEMEAIPYAALKSFGPSGDEFRLMFAPASEPQRTHTLSECTRNTLRGNTVLLFSMPQEVEATLTIAGYINAIVTAHGVTCAEASISQLVHSEDAPPS
ncbi:hypothetical protein PTSG_01654 [Salpingoeca rosetta]|uniref:PH domain-containing protein n=1 Tax=Salpingoeca rosetta (strain ATCC 50818 / BSB-021) TaxID=946362 RepID=F2TYK1_SALR5|nr:uncharacterized protein PTSG_01654 [Salpingoeca rosetta]EGD78675.1 hypothetical protein PTSG_01654 [Salpingoeca rosetta]|eukprot:XP_004997632.1 hypothetical protein PTSG_01654 [Salpingoeca rosetta]